MSEIEYAGNSGKWARSPSHETYAQEDLKPEPFTRNRSDRERQARIRRENSLMQVKLENIFREPPANFHAPHLDLSLARPASGGSPAPPGQHGGGISLGLDTGGFPPELSGVYGRLVAPKGVVFDPSRVPLRGSCMPGTLHHAEAEKQWPPREPGHRSDAAQRRQREIQVENERLARRLLENERRCLPDSYLVLSAKIPLTRGQGATSRPRPTSAAASRRRDEEHPRDDGLSHRTRPRSAEFRSNNNPFSRTSIICCSSLSTAGASELSPIRQSSKGDSSVDPDASATSVVAVNAHMAAAARSSVYLAHAPASLSRVSYVAAPSSTNPFLAATSSPPIVRGGGSSGSANSAARVGGGCHRWHPGKSMLRADGPEPVSTTALEYVSVPKSIGVVCCAGCGSKCYYQQPPGAPGEPFAAQKSSSRRSRFGRCPHCREAWYCSSACAVLDWPSHRATCKLPARSVGNAAGGKPSDSFWVRNSALAEVRRRRCAAAGGQRGSVSRLLQSLAADSFSHGTRYDAAADDDADEDDILAQLALEQSYVELRERERRAEREMEKFLERDMNGIDGPRCCMVDLDTFRGPVLWRPGSKSKGRSLASGAGGGGGRERASFFSKASSQTSHGLMRQGPGQSFGDNYGEGGSASPSPSALTLEVTSGGVDAPPPPPTSLWDSITGHGNAAAKPAQFKYYGGGRPAFDARVRLTEYGGLFNDASGGGTVGPGSGSRRRSGK